MVWKFLGQIVNTYTFTDSIIFFYCKSVKTKYPTYSDVCRFNLLAIWNIVEVFFCFYFIQTKNVTISHWRFKFKFQLQYVKHANDNVVIYCLATDITNVHNGVCDHGAGNVNFHIFLTVFVSRDFTGRLANKFVPLVRPRKKREIRSPREQ